jgi:hypothetical protein
MSAAHPLRKCLLDGFEFAALQNGVAEIAFRSATGQHLPLAVGEGALEPSAPYRPRPRVCPDDNF